MSGPTTRVLTVLELLQTHGQIGGAELAERLGVTGEPSAATSRCLKTWAFR